MIYWGKYNMLNTCRKGWQSLIEETIKEVHKVDPKAIIEYAKEKFGVLSFGTPLEYYNKEVEDILHKAEIKSRSICENCGAVGKIDLDKFGFWLKCFCDPCREEENKKIVLKTPELKPSKKTLKNAKRQMKK